MSIYTDTDFVPCYKGGRCEDAPCCGCGPETSGYDEPYDYDDYDTYSDYDDEPEMDDDGPLWDDQGGEDAWLDGSYEE